MKEFGKRILGGQSPAWRGWPYLLTLLISFSAGALGGFLLAFLGEPSAELGNYLVDYFTLAVERELDFSFISVCWDCVRWPLLVVLFGFTSLGVVVIPAAFLVRGFLLSYTVACFGILLGNKGVAAAAVLFSVTVLLILPILFVVGCENLRTSCMRLSGSPSITEPKFKPEILLPSFGALAIAVALQWAVSPTLLSAVCVRLF